MLMRYTLFITLIFGEKSASNITKDIQVLHKF